MKCKAGSYSCFTEAPVSSIEALGVIFGIRTSPQVLCNPAKTLPQFAFSYVMLHEASFSVSSHLGFVVEYLLGKTSERKETILLRYVVWFPDFTAAINYIFALVVLVILFSPPSISIIYSSRYSYLSVYASEVPPPPPFFNRRGWRGRERKIIIINYHK